MIPLVWVLPTDKCNFLFYLTIQANLILYTHIIYHKTSKILVRNISDCPLHISYCQKLSHIIDIIYDNSFLIDTQTAFDSAASLLAILPFLDLGARLALMPANKFMKTQLNNKVRVYGDTITLEEISKLVAEYFSI